MNKLTLSSRKMRQHLSGTQYDLRLEGLGPGDFRYAKIPG